MTSLRIEPVTFRLVAYCLNTLCYRVPHVGCRTDRKVSNSFLEEQRAKDDETNTSPMGNMSEVTWCAQEYF
jgi:hypothetical protein